MPVPATMQPLGPVGCLANAAPFLHRFCEPPRRWSYQNKSAACSRHCLCTGGKRRSRPSRDRRQALRRHGGQHVFIAGRIVWTGAGRRGHVCERRLRGRTMSSGKMRAGICADRSGLGRWSQKDWCHAAGYCKRCRRPGRRLGPTGAGLAALVKSEQSMCAYVCIHQLSAYHTPILMSAIRTESTGPKACSRDGTYRRTGWRLAARGIGGLSCAPAQSLGQLRISLAVRPVCVLAGSAVVSAGGRAGVDLCGPVAPRCHACDAAIWRGRGRARVKRCAGGRAP